MGNPTLCVVLATNQKYAFACGTMAINVLRQVKNVDTIIIYCDSLTELTRHALNNLDARIKLIQENMETVKGEFAFIDQLTLSLYFFKRYSYLSAIKFRIFKLLEEFDKVMLLDTDMLLLDSLDDILNNSNSNIIWRDDNTSIQCKLIRYGWKNYNEDIIRDYMQYPTPNAGFIVLNKNFDYNEAYELGKRFCERACKYHPVSIDETTFGYVVAKMKLDVLRVNRRIYNVFPCDFGPEAKLLHFLGSYKPWNNRLIQYGMPQWLTYYKEFAHKVNIESKEVKIFDNYGSIITNAGYAAAFANLLSDIIVPTGWCVQKDLQTNKIKMFFDSCIYINLGFDSSKQNITVSICINKYLVKTVDRLEAMLINVISKKLKMKFTEHNEYCIVVNDKINRVDFPRFFVNVMQQCNELFAKIESSSPVVGAKIGYLRTYFDKYVALKDGFLYQDEDRASICNISCLRIEGFVALRSKNGLYVKQISEAGQVTMDNYPHLFPVKSETEFLIITNMNKYLSARNDKYDSIMAVQNCQDWEKFVWFSAYSGDAGDVPVKKSLSENNVFVLKTFFNKHLAFKNGRLCQLAGPDDENVINCMINAGTICLRVNSGKYICAIYNSGRALLAENPHFFYTKKLFANIKIVAGNGYLSARNDESGSVTIVPHGLDWENFILEPVA